MLHTQYANSLVFETCKIQSCPFFLISVSSLSYTSSSYPANFLAGTFRSKSTSSSSYVRPRAAEGSALKLSMEQVAHTFRQPEERPGGGKQRRSSPKETSLALQVQLGRVDEVRMNDVSDDLSYIVDVAAQADRFRAQANRARFTDDRVAYGTNSC